MAPRNRLSNLAKRDVAYSGRADIGDVPQLYELRAAMERERAAQMGGTPGLGGSPEGGGGLPFSGGGGAVGGNADSGLPGLPFASPALESEYTRSIRRMGGDAPDRGTIASRGAINLDPSDPFGVEFGEDLSDFLGLASYADQTPLTSAAKQFVDLMVKDAQFRSDKFFEGLTTGENIDVVNPPGMSVTRRSSGYADPDIEPDISGGYGQDTLGGPTGNDTFSDAGSMGEGGGGGDAGSGGGGADSGGGGMGCFAKGTSVLMSDGTEKPIEQIQLGDMVMGFSEGDDPEPCEVIGRFAHRSKPVWRLNGNTLVTPGHRFFAMIGTNGYGFWPLEEIPLGARIMAGDGSSVVVETIEDAGEQRDVFNITVQRMHTYIANGYRVHNIKHMGGLISEDRVPDQTRGDVDETLMEGEYVITADAVDMLGPHFFEGINRLARMAKRR